MDPIAEAIIDLVNTEPQDQPAEAAEILAMYHEIIDYDPKLYSLLVAVMRGERTI